MEDFLVSIVLPVYNVSNYIERVLYSISNQTYSNIECLIIDDCGSDDSIEKANLFINHLNTPQRSRFKIIHHDINRGLSAARNTGSLNSKGLYVYFCDSDDELPLDAIYNLVQTTKAYPQVDMVVGNMIKLTDTGEVIMPKYNFAHYPKYSNDKNWIIKNIFDYSNGYFIPSLAQNKLYRHDFLTMNKLSFYEGIIHEDEKFVFDIANVITSLAFCDDITYKHYITPNSIMTSLNQDKSAAVWIKIIHTSYPQFETPYVDLKLLYSLGELKRCFFCLSKDARNTVGREMKLLLNELSRYSKDKGYEWLSILYKFLYLTPFFITNNKFMQKVYKRLYNFKRLVVKCKF